MHAPPRRPWLAGTLALCLGLAASCATRTPSPHRPPAPPAPAVAPAPPSAPQAPARAAEAWPQYRGLNRDGVIPGTALTWPAAGPREVWRQASGPGFSQLSVDGGAVFTGLADESQEYLVRLDAATGREIWRHPLGPVFKSEFGDGPRSTPTVDGDLVFILGASGALHAVRASDGAPAWTVHLTARFGSEVPRFGYSPAPLVLDGLVLVEAGGKEEAALVALERATGELRWSALSGPAGYSSPVVATLGGVRQVILPRGKTVTSLSAQGEVLWTFEMEEPMIAMPVPVAGDRLFVSAMGDTGCALLEVRMGLDGRFSVQALWRNRNMRNHFNSSVVLGDAIYGFDNATLKCLSLDTGEVRWAKRGLGKGSLIGVGRDLLVLSDRGMLVLVEGTSEAYREKGSVQALEGKSWTAPSFAAGRVYLRNLSERACLELKEVA